MFDEYGQLNGGLIKPNLRAFILSHHTQAHILFCERKLTSDRDFALAMGFVDHLCDQKLCQISPGDTFDGC